MLKVLQVCVCKDVCVEGVFVRMFVCQNVLC